MKSIWSLKSGFEVDFEVHFTKSYIQDFVSRHYAVLSGQKKKPLFFGGFLGANDKIRYMGF